MYLEEFRGRMPRVEQLAESYTMKYRSLSPRERLVINKSNWFRGRRPKVDILAETVY